MAPISLTDDGENVIYYIPAPYMTDAQDAYSEAVAYTLTQAEDGSWILTVTADRGWMEAEDRAYPVAIDPTLIDQTKEADFEGTVCTTGMNYTMDGSKFACGYHPDYQQMEVFFRLNQYPDIPAGHTLVRAYAGLYQNDWRSGATNQYDREAQFVYGTLTRRIRPWTAIWSGRAGHRTAGAGLRGGQLSYHCYYAPMGYYCSSKRVVCR